MRAVVLLVAFLSATPVAASIRAESPEMDEPALGPGRGERSARLMDTAGLGETGGTAWRVAGVFGGGFTGAAFGLVGLPVLVQGARGSRGLVSGMAWAGLGLGFAVGSLPGFLAGRLAAKDSLWAEILVVALVVFAVPTLLAGVFVYALATHNFPGGS